MKNKKEHILNVLILAYCIASITEINTSYIEIAMYFIKNDMPFLMYTNYVLFRGYIPIKCSTYNTK